MYPQPTTGAVAKRQHRLPVTGCGWLFIHYREMMIALNAKHDPVMWDDELGTWSILKVSNGTDFEPLLMAEEYMYNA